MRYVEKSRKCQDCGNMTTWIPYEQCHRCVVPTCFKGGSNVGYYGSPAYVQHTDGDKHQIGLILNIPPSGFHTPKPEFTTSVILDSWKRIFIWCLRSPIVAILTTAVLITLKFWN